MWSRKELKQNAKILMHKRYSQMLGVSSLYLILSGTIFFTINYYYTQINDVINEPSTPIYSIEPDQNFILFFNTLVKSQELFYLYLY